jgi:hypothetical protein
MLPTSLLVLLAALAAAPAVQSVVPSFRDLTIKIRETRGINPPMATAWYFKGPRERSEHYAEGTQHVGGYNASIMQCDLRTIIHLNKSEKTYTSFRNGAVDHDGSRPTRLRPLPTEPDVTVTMDSVDTGERRQVAGYEARHIKSTVTITPSKGAATKPGKVVLDTWYLDLPGLYCLEGNTPRHLDPLVMRLIRPQGVHDRIVVNYAGVVPSGFVIEENGTQRVGRNVIVNKTELLEVSDQPLDDSLFEVPPDYSPAQPGQPMVRGTVVERR